MGCLGCWRQRPSDEKRALKMLRLKKVTTTVLLLLVVLTAIGCRSDSPVQSSRDQPRRLSLRTDGTWHTKEVIPDSQAFPDDWQLFNAVSQPEAINDIEAIDKETAWAVGNGGTIFKLTRGAWHAQSSNTRTDLLDASAGDGESAWAIGADGIVLNTSDGGTNWSARKIIEGRPRSIAAVDNNNILMADGSSIIKTDDGGSTWKTYSLTEDLSASITAIDACSAGTYWVFGTMEKQAFVLMSDDSGRTWEDRSPRALEGKVDVACAADDGTAWMHVVVNNDKGMIKKTDDGGRSWHEVCVPKGYTVSDMCALEGGLLWTCGSWLAAGPGVLVTSDGGRSWSKQPLRARAKRIAAVDINTAWIAGPSISGTADSGKTWDLQVEAIQGKIIGALSLARDGALWASCGSGLVLLSLDGGETWHQRWLSDDPLARTYQDPTLCAVDSRNAWVLPENHSTFIMKTADGGVTWQAIKTMANSIYGFDSPAAEVLWLLGRDSSSDCLLKTEDRGNTWLYKGFSSTDGVSIERVCVVDGGAAWASGPGEVVMNTQDGGESWRVVHRKPPAEQSRVSVAPAFLAARSLSAASDARKNCGTPPPVPFLSAVDENVAAIAMNWKKRALITLDAGSTWQDISPPEFTDGSQNEVDKIESLLMVDSETLWILCSVGTSSETPRCSLFLTRDGGRSWTREDINQSAHSFAASADAVWLGLSNGLVMRRQY